ncbi:MAG: TonB family protein [Flavobacteriales bacterium]|nr:TonB family protein [Flavobacteriales bacterium]
MEEFVRYILISNLTLIAVLLSYRMLLQRTTFHGINRGFLLIGSVVSLLVPLLPFSTETQEVVLGVQLPTIDFSQPFANAPLATESFNWPLYLYLTGVIVSLLFFVRGMVSIILLFRNAETETINGTRVSRSDSAGPFSFLSCIHLPKKLSVHHQEVILNHELAHVRLGHSYDVLWLQLLRIVFWFNPLLVFYQRAIQEIHEYQADALTYISSSKEHYVKVQLDQLFQLPSELSFANSFNNSNDLKKRVNMIYSEKSSKWGGMRYLIALPLLAVIGLMAACTETPVDAVQEQAEEVYKTADVMPEFPGGMQEMMSYMMTSIKYPESAKADSVSGKVFVQFVVDKTGKVGQIEVVRGVRDDLDAEAVRVISEMPNWTAGMQNGKKVSVQMVLPIFFKLE